MKQEIKDLANLDKLVAGDEFSIYRKTTELSHYPGIKPEISYGIQLEYSYGWEDTHKDTTFLILAKGHDTTRISSLIVPKEWFKIEEKHGLIIEEPAHERLKQGPHCCGSIYIPHEPQFGLLYRAIIREPPKPEEIENFRRGDEYHNFFKLTQQSQLQNHH